MYWSCLPIGSRSRLISISQACSASAWAEVTRPSRAAKACNRPTVKLLDDPRLFVRRRAIETLGERGGRGSRRADALASLIRTGKTPLGRVNAVWAATRIDHAEARKAIRHALTEHEATFPDQKGKPIQTPTARGVFHYFVGIHVLYIPGQGLFVLNLTDEHLHLLQLLGKRYVWFYR